jgi:hypothetical protein
MLHFLLWRGDTSWRARCSTSEDLACHHINFSTHFQFYVLELHHLTPLGIPHMVALVTLCEAYIGIEPHINLWSYFFHARLR